MIVVSGKGGIEMFIEKVVALLNAILGASYLIELAS